MSEALTAAAVNSGMIAFLSFMPRPSQILDDENAGDLTYRINEASAAVITVGLGVALSFIARSGSPLIASMVTAAAMVAGYEYLARTTDERIARERTERLSNVAI